MSSDLALRRDDINEFIERLNEASESPRADFVGGDRNTAEALEASLSFPDVDGTHCGVSMIDIVVVFTRSSDCGSAHVCHTVRRRCAAFRAREVCNRKGISSTLDSCRKC